MNCKQIKRYLNLVIFILFSLIAIVSTSDALKYDEDSVTITNESEWTTEIISTETSIPDQDSSSSSENQDEKNDSLSPTSSPLSSSSSSSSSSSEEGNENSIKKKWKDIKENKNMNHDINMQTQLVLSRNLIRYFQREIQNLKSSLYLYKRSHQLEIDSVHEKLRSLNIILDNRTNAYDDNKIQSENTRTKLKIYQISSQIQSIQHSIQQIRDEVEEQRRQLQNYNKTSTTVSPVTGDQKFETPIKNVMRMTQHNDEMDSLKQTIEEQKIELNAMKKALTEVQKNSDEQKKQMERLTGINLSHEHPKDCMDITKQRNSTENTQVNESRKMNPVQYLIYPLGSEEDPSRVVCDEEWTVIQQRRSGPREEFYRNWNDYEQGFYTSTASDIKDPLGNYWIGLKAIESLTRSEPQELRIELTDWEGESRFAQYSHFSISNATDLYRLFIANYSGNAGDSLAYHNDSPFSTWDQDNDDLPVVNCAQQFHGGWWYKACLRSNLNGLYRAKSEIPTINADALVWEKYKGLDYSLRIVQMKIRPKRNS